MKRMLLILIILAMTCGCTGQKSFETISDNYVDDIFLPMEAVFTLSDDFVTPAFCDDNGNEIYICNDYSVETNLMPAGDIKKTISEITGFEMDKISIIQTESEGVKRYECTWTSTGENTLLICRAAILDDGYYHYALTAKGDQESTSVFNDQWQEIFQSYTLTNAD